MWAACFHETTAIPSLFLSWFFQMFFLWFTCATFVFAKMRVFVVFNFRVASEISCGNLFIFLLKIENNIKHFYKDKQQAQRIYMTFASTPHSCPHLSLSILLSCISSSSLSSHISVYSHPAPLTDLFICPASIYPTRQDIYLPAFPHSRPFLHSTVHIPRAKPASAFSMSAKTCQNSARPRGKTLTTAALDLKWHRNVKNMKSKHHERCIYCLLPLTLTSRVMMLYAPGMQKHLIFIFQPPKVKTSVKTSVPQ